MREEGRREGTRESTLQGEEGRREGGRRVCGGGGRERVVGIQLDTYTGGVTPISHGCDCRSKLGPALFSILTVDLADFRGFDR